MINIEKMLFDQHARSANKRGISFEFNLWEWLDWWETNLGPDWIEKRGLKKGQYVMARKNDSGPYAPWNVKCITVGNNSSEANRGRRKRGPRLTSADVLKIYKSEKPNTILAKDYAVTTGLIGRIKRGITWQHVTRGHVSPPRHKGPKGASAYNAILNDAKVLKIRKSKKSKRELATQYGVHYNTICNILSGRQWKHLL